MPRRIVLDRAQSPLFDRFCVWKQAESAFRRLVWLKSGGYLVFDYTEALTVVDVNTGKFVGKRSLSETVFALNCEAAREIARQLRLRDVGGIIVIDFIDMDRSRSSAKRFWTCCANACARIARAPTWWASPALGLVELTRKKVRQPAQQARWRTSCAAVPGQAALCPPTESYRPPGAVRKCGGAGCAETRRPLIMPRRRRRWPGMLLQAGRACQRGQTCVVLADEPSPRRSTDIEPVRSERLPSGAQLLKRIVQEETP